MKKLYLVLAIIGFIAPTISVLKECFDSGNAFYWADPTAVYHWLFGNSISTAFIVDLFIAVVVFFIWAYAEAKRIGIKNTWRIWVLTFLFGMGGSFALFLYWREKKLNVLKAVL